ncbi:hypothetical protein BAUCODRAFT_28440 [Baudoinia panamericana UAMH 10762]|uniref:Myb-like domain-containing protein n=1 Tax=Baudoinia panamericana (strain UAMH 10762) TaxID=717646 RepID=M2MXD4_BAUPA|nr:uncharacterized protein BAUCODRAFT_28440 [Baudoinia panamericana UAMH 10762]EMC91319.1 hypothetical protein BAUCODRAFT_28440 [Baudoinia panamericana UAMH 10762]
MWRSLFRAGDSAAFAAVDVLLSTSLRHQWRRFCERVTPRSPWHRSRASANVKAPSGRLRCFLGVREERREYSTPKTGHGSRVRWTPEETGKLLQLRSEGLDHAAIASHFPGRTAGAISNRITKLISKREADVTRRPSASLTSDEITKLDKLTTEGLPWPQIAQSFPAHTAQTLRNCMRALRQKEQAVKHGRFSTEEDEKLLSLVATTRLPWTEIAAAMGRATKIVHRRYHLLVPPDQRILRRRAGALSDEEVEIMRMMKSKGGSFRQIATVLGRYSTTIAETWHRLHDGVEPRTWGAPPQRPVPFDRQDDLIIWENRKKGLSFRQIGRLLQTTRSGQSISCRYRHLADLKRIGREPTYIMRVDGAVDSPTAGTESAKDTAGELSTHSPP